MATFNLRRALTAQGEGKALGVHPAFMGRDPVSVYSPGANRQKALISQREATRHLDAYGGSQAIDWVYDCVGLYADPASTADFRLEKADGTRLVRNKTKGTPKEYEVGPEALYKLLDQPNPFMLYDELITLLVIDLLMVGNGYWLKWRTNAAGQPLALYRLAPSHVKIVPGQFGPERYEYQPPGAKDKLLIRPDEVIHFKRPNPHSAYYGMGVIQGAGRAMDLEIAVTDTMASYYENKADPSLIIQSERRVPRDVFNKMRAQLRGRASGSDKAGELLLLEAGLKASTLSASASDALFDRLAQMSRNRVYGKFRASPALFGEEASGSDKVSDFRAEFDNSALRPFLKRLSTQITVALADSWDCKFFIDHRSTLPAEVQMKVVESIAALPGTKVREIRRQLEQFGIDESTGDPEIDNLVLNMPTPEIDENGMTIDPKTGAKVRGDKVGADRPLGSEPGRPPKAENTRAIGQGKALDEILGLLDERIEADAKAVSTPAPDNRLPGEQRPDDTFSAARGHDIDAVSAQIRAGLRDASVQLERDLLDVVEGKALKTSDIVSRMRKAKAWDTFKERVEAVLLEASRTAAQSGVMHSGLLPEEEIDYDDIAKSVVHRSGGLRSIVATLKDSVARRIKEAREGSAERTEYETAIRSVIATWADGKAGVIAETEAVHAYNEATLVTAEAAGLTQVYVTDGDDDDEPCRQANGQVWEIDFARQNRLEHPNCRRAFLPLPLPEVA